MKRPWAVVTMFAFLGPPKKLLHEEWVTGVVAHDLDGHLHPG